MKTSIKNAYAQSKNYRQLASNPHFKVDKKKYAGQLVQRLGKHHAVKVATSTFRELLPFMKEQSAN